MLSRAKAPEKVLGRQDSRLRIVPGEAGLAGQDGFEFPIDGLSQGPLVGVGPLVEERADTVDEIGAGYLLTGGVGD